MSTEGKRLLKVYIINQTFHWFIIGLFFPIMILFMLDKGLDIFQTGAAMAIYSATTVFLELPTGGLSDSIGRKNVYLISQVVSFVAIIILLLSWSFLTVAIGTLVYGVARSLSSGSIDAWFVDEFNRAEPQGNLQSALAKAGFFLPLGIGLGSLLGGLIPMFLGGFAISVGLSLYSMNIIVMMAFIVVQIILTNILVIEQAVSQNRGRIMDGFKNVPEVIRTSVEYGVKNRTVLILLLVFGVFGFSLTSVELLWQPQVQVIIGVETQTWIFGVLAAGYFFFNSIGNLLATPLCSLFNNNYSRALGVIQLLNGIALFVLAMQSSLLGFAAFYLGFFFIQGVGSSPQLALFNAQVPPNRRSTMLSFQSLVLQGGGLSGNLILGYVANTTSIPTAWMIAAAVLAASSAGYFYLGARASTGISAPSSQ